jgi:hypothetical protein
LGGGFFFFFFFFLFFFFQANFSNLPIYHVHAVLLSALRVSHSFAYTSGGVKQRAAAPGIDQVSWRLTHRHVDIATGESVAALVNVSLANATATARGWDPASPTRLYLPYSRSEFPADPTRSWGVMGTTGPRGGATVCVLLLFLLLLLLLLFVCLFFCYSVFMY